MEKWNLTSKIAAELICENQLTHRHCQTEEGRAYASILLDAMPVVRQKVRKLSAAALGVICAQAPSWYRMDSAGQPVDCPLSDGRATTGLYDVHLGTWVGKRWDGLSILREVAATAIAARMFDILMANASASR